MVRHTRQLGSTSHRHRAITLTEMVVVVAIIVIMLAAVLPSVSSTWAERKASQAEITVRGALATVRMQALNKTERGLFFTLDPVTGAQLIYTIVAKPADPITESPLPPQDAADRFEVLDGRVITLPDPYRVTPRSVVDKETSSTWVWDDAELTNPDYRGGTQTTFQRQRNHFTVIFSRDGQLRAKRNVLIYDRDANGDTFGDHTGLQVSSTASPSTNWFDGTAQQALSLGLSDVINDSANGALNFASVDGLVVYDDSSFRELPAVDDRRDYLLKTGVPLYISQLSGAVVRGPSGENE